jgi:hypothetical protein
MNPLPKFMASPAGRIPHSVAGIVLVLLDQLVMHGVGGMVVAVIGLLPMVTGLFDFYSIAPFFGNPKSGAMIHAGK